VSTAATAEPETETVWRPATDVYRTPGGWLVKFDLAGVEPKDIELTAMGRALRVRGRRRDCCLADGCRQVRMEIAYSHFERQVELPDDVQSAHVTTEFRHGMLLVRIQRGAYA
jgi:HSP20 family protein